MSDIIPTVTLHPGELTAHPANSNTHSRANIEELAESRRLFDQYKNVVTWSPSEEITVEIDGQPVTLKPGIKYVIAGNGFHQASLLRQDDAIEVKDYSHLSYDEALLLMETDNASPLGSKPDPVRMRANLDRARGLIADNPRMAAMMDRARERAGISGNETGLPAEPPEVTQTEAERLAEVYGTRLGQVWQLDEHRLVVGDCTDKAVVEAVLRGEEIESVIADPPYGIDWNADYTRFTTKYGTRRINHNPIANDNISFDPSLWLDYPKVVLWGANWYCKHIPLGSWLVWDKRHPNGAAWLSDAEIAWMKGKRGVYLYAETVQGAHRKEKSMHPTQKPVGLMEWCIQKADVAKDVFDPYLGSGTTLIACEQLGRHCRGVEIAPGYAAVSIQRWVDLTGQEPKLIAP